MNTINVNHTTFFFFFSDASKHEGEQTNGLACVACLIVMHLAALSIFLIWEKKCMKYNIGIYFLVSK